MLKFGIQILFHRPLQFSSIFQRTNTNYQISRIQMTQFVQEIITKLQSPSAHRPTLASTITLVKTEHPVKKAIATQILQRILSSHPQNNSTLRIGLSGPPGAGKSSFIEVFGKYLTSLGLRVAVLAVDPSSSTSGGSILGDKTRMTELSRDPNAFIRPSPARGHLGGVTRSTNESILLCEFCGYEVILVETVGVGQSETAVADMVDCFVLLLPPGGGDELQGVKRGIVELANILLITKFDGDFVEPALRTQYEYTSALKFLRSNTPNWKTKVIPISSRTKAGIPEFWKLINQFKNTQLQNGHFELKRRNQRVQWMWSHIEEGLHDLLFQSQPRVSKLVKSLESSVKNGQMSPGIAADRILDYFKNVLEKNKE